MNDNIVKLFSVVKKAKVPHAESIVSALEWWQIVPENEREIALKYLRIDVNSRRHGPQQNPRAKKEKA